MVHDFNSVKLVLGNGFDLYCGLKTKYSDYFNYWKSKYEAINTWRKEYYFVNNYFRKEISNNDNFWEEIENFEMINVWDLLFCFLSVNSEIIEKWRWCDIESEIEKSLKTSNDYGDLTWNKVFDILNAQYNRLDGYNHDVLLMAAFLKKRYGIDRFSNQNVFFKVLLDELKRFEKNFGNYIHSLTHPKIEMTFGINPTAISYSKTSKITLEKLCNLDNVSSIDTFNYDTLEIEELENMVNNINGDVSNPIFGVDTDVFEAEDPRFIFTKTSRRMELDMIKREDSGDKEFENVIIFGHSLSKADFSYFFSIFDRIKITDLTSKSKVVFAYSIYDQNKQEEIMSDIRKSVTYMFQEYSKYKNGFEHKNRLLDQLTTQRKVILYDVNSSKYD